MAGLQVPPKRASQTQEAFPQCAQISVHDGRRQIAAVLVMTNRQRNKGLPQGEAAQVPT